MTDKERRAEEKAEIAARNLRYGHTRNRKLFQVIVALESGAKSVEIVANVKNQILSMFCELGYDMIAGSVLAR